MDLYSDEHTFWYQHVVYGQDIDLAFMPVPRLPDYPQQHLNLSAQISKVDRMYMGEDVFVLGYPLSFSLTGTLPIWKRASIATLPTFEIDKKPVFLIDTATREGMSGSPVIYPIKTLMIEEDEGVLRIYRFAFAGVYSGRFEEKDALGSALGVVWRNNFISEMINNHTFGSFILREQENRKF
jgi:hypothetical protein